MKERNKEEGTDNVFFWVDVAVNNQWDTAQRPFEVKYLYDSRISLFLLSDFPYSGGAQLFIKMFKELATLFLS